MKVVLMDPGKTLVDNILVRHLGIHCQFWRSTNIFQWYSSSNNWSFAWSLDAVRICEHIWLKRQVNETIRLSFVTDEWNVLQIRPSIASRVFRPPIRGRLAPRKRHLATGALKQATPSIVDGVDNQRVLILLPRATTTTYWHRIWWKEYCSPR